jgi:hypothetical protein
VTISEFEQLLRDSGVDDATVRTMIANEKLAQKTSGIRQGSEYDSLERRALDLERQMNGVDGKPGAAAYQKWYSENYATIEQLKADVTRYNERYGSLDEPQKPTGGNVSLDDAAIKRLVDEQVQSNFANNYSPKVVQTMTSVATVMERHLKRGRKNDVDWEAIDKLAASTNGDVKAAYDKWDEPNMKVDQEEAENKRVEARVAEELKKRGSAATFPAGADGASSTVSPLSRDGRTGGYDRSKLMDTFISGEYTRQ